MKTSIIRMETTISLAVRGQNDREITLWMTKTTPELEQDIILRKSSKDITILRDPSKNTISLEVQTGRTILEIVFQNENLGPRQVHLPSWSLGPESVLTLERDENGVKKIQCPMVRDWCKNCQQEIGSNMNLKEHESSCTQTPRQDVRRALKWVDNRTEPKPPSSKKMKTQPMSPDDEARKHVKDVCPLVATCETTVEVNIKAVYDCTLKEISIPIFYTSVEASSLTYTKGHLGNWITYTADTKLEEGKEYQLDFKIKATPPDREALPNFKINHESCHLPVRMKVALGDQFLTQTLFMYCRTHPAVDDLSAGEYVEERTETGPGRARNSSALHNKDWLRIAEIPIQKQAALRILATFEGDRAYMSDAAKGEVTSMLRTMAQPLDSNSYSAQQKSFCLLDLSQKEGVQGTFLNIPVITRDREHFVGLKPQQMGKWGLRPGHTISLRVGKIEPVQATYIGMEPGPHGETMPFFESEGGPPLPENSVAVVSKTNNHFMLNLTLQSLEASTSALSYLFPGPHTRKLMDVNFYQKILSPEQQLAVKAAMGADKTTPFLVQGPAGSGKSQVGIEIAMQTMAKMGGPILMTAPTNIAADELALKMKRMTEQHLPHLQVRRFSAENHSSALCPNLCFLDDKGKHKMPSCDVFTNSLVLVSTVASAGRLGYTKAGPIRFTSIIMDESGFPLEYQQSVGFVPLTQNGNQPRLVLLGDIYQISQKSWLNVAKQWTVNQSLFHRLMNLPVYNVDDCNKVVLNDNHRNPPRIVFIMNLIAYAGMIKAVGKHSGPGELHAIHVLGGNQKTFQSNLILPEALAVTRLVKHLQSKQPSLSYVVICFYRAQATAIRQLCIENEVQVEVKSAETAQGGEADVVVLSPASLLMDPLMEGRGAWMREPSRTLVALSRAKQAFFLVGNIIAATSSPPLRFIIEEAQRQKRLTIPSQLRNVLEDRLKIYNDIDAHSRIAAHKES